MRHVIIGVGAAGVAAARIIRELRPGDEITMVSADTSVHSRCMLHHYLGGTRSEESLCFAPEGFFEEGRIEWKSGVFVERIDVGSKKLHTSGGEEIPYDTLLIATGANSVIPPVGALRTAPNVFGLRDLADAKAIAEAAEPASEVVVIGSGLVGLDAAHGLLNIGKRVTVVEMADRILPLQLDAHAAEAYQELFEKNGVAFRLGISAKDTELDENGNVTAILLASGERLPCDLAVVAAGVRPAIGLLKESGIEADKRVEVDCGMRTSAPDVYAAGDVTGLSGIWPNAVKQGEVAGRNMCGENVLYDDTYALKNTINFYGLPTLSIGRISPAEGENDEVVTREDRRRYEKIIMRDGVVRGVLLQGDIDNSGFWQYLIKNEIDVSKYADDIWRLSYADFQSMDERGEYAYSVSA